MRSQAEGLEDDTGGQRVVEIRGAGDLNTGEGQTGEGGDTGKNKPKRHRKRN